MADAHSKWTCCERSVLQSMSVEIALNSIGDLYSFRFERNRFDRIDEDLCDVLFSQRDLITIFQFDGEKSHCYLEEAILQSLFNGETGIFSHRAFFEWVSFIFSKQIFEQRSTISSESIETRNGRVVLFLSISRFIDLL